MSWERVTDDTERLKVPGGWSYQRTRDDGTAATWFVEGGDDGALPMPAGAYVPAINPSGPGIVPQRHRPHSSRAFDATPQNRYNQFGRAGSGGAPVSADGAEGRWGYGRPPEVSPTGKDRDVLRVTMRGRSVEEQNDYFDYAQREFQKNGWKPE